MNVTGYESGKVVDSSHGLQINSEGTFNDFNNLGLRDGR